MALVKAEEKARAETRAEVRTTRHLKEKEGPHKRTQVAKELAATSAQRKEAAKTQEAQTAVLEVAAAARGAVEATSSTTELTLRLGRNRQARAAARARESPTITTTTETATALGPRTFAWEVGAATIPAPQRQEQGEPAGPGLAFTIPMEQRPSCPTTLPPPLYQEGTAPRPPWVCCRCRVGAAACCGRTVSSSRKEGLPEWEVQVVGTRSSSSSIRTYSSSSSR